jgi:hypothetical protein
MFQPLPHSYHGTNFGFSSAWQSFSGDFNGDGYVDYLRVGPTGAWLFRGSDACDFPGAFQSFDGPPFDDSSKWQVITGDFNGDGRTDYARLGDTKAYLFSGRSNNLFEVTQQDYDVSFGEHSLWQVVTGKFSGGRKTDYARLGDIKAVVFSGQ